MTRHTPLRNLPYPEGSDEVAVHSDIAALALKTDIEIHQATENVAADTAEAMLGYIAPFDTEGAVAGNVVITPTRTGGTKTITLLGDARLFVNPAQPGAVVTLVITQGTGGPHDVTWPPNVLWQDAPELSTSPETSDVVTLLCVDGLSWLGFLSGGQYMIPERKIVDSFNRPDADTLGATETGQPWVAPGWGIRNNRAQTTGTIGIPVAALDTGSADSIRVSIEARQGAMAGSTNQRLSIRESSDRQSMYTLAWVHLHNAGTAYIQRSDASGTTNMGEHFSLNAEVGDRIGLSCVINNGAAVLTVTRNSDTVTTRTDQSPIPAGTWASFEYNGASVKAGIVDNFQVEYL